MDVDVTLSTFRTATVAYNEAMATGDVDTAILRASEALTAADDLDRWLSRGGFMPRAWTAF